MDILEFVFTRTRLKIAVASAACLFVMACATAVVPEATTASRADGTVTLAFEYGLFDKPVVNWEHADASATARCRVWGYSGAEKFDAGSRKCEARNGDGICLRWAVSVNYQCTGNPSTSPSSQASVAMPSTAQQDYTPASNSNTGMQRFDQWHDQSGQNSGSSR